MTRSMASLDACLSPSANRPSEGITVVPTPRGWLVATTGVVLVVLGLGFGSTALQQLGLALVILLGLAVAVVRLGRHDLEVSRTIAPQRARPEQTVTLTIDIVNKSHGAAPLLLLEDRLPAGLSGGARFALFGIEEQGHRTTSLSLRATRRGRYSVGPLSISIVDPFSLARIRSTASPISSFLVHPRVEQLTMPRDLGERRSLATSSMKQPTGARGEDFYTMREYVEGDDLRKIHWPSTAKRGRYMIRQEETPWHTRATILLDDRSQGHEGFGAASSFERSVESAASLVDLYHRSGYSYRLAGAHNVGIAVSRGSDHWSRCLDLLAEIGAQRGPEEADALLLRLTELESTSSAEAALLVVAGQVDAKHAMALTRLKRRFRQVTLVCFPPHRFGSAGTKARWAGERSVVEVVRLLGRSGIRTVTLGPDESMAAGWATLSQPRTKQVEETWGPRPELV